jgi:dCTP deaminase
MILSDEDIRRYIRKGYIVFSPELAPDQIGGASVDLTLGDKFWFFKQNVEGKDIDLKTIGFQQVTKKVVAKKITLAPGQMCHGITKEKITLPPDIMGRLEGRSRYARMGLAIHVTSAIVQPGSSNRQILEIVNFAPFSSTIHEGMRISQVVFEKLQSPTNTPYAKFGSVARGQ